MKVESRQVLFSWFVITLALIMVAQYWWDFNIIYDTLSSARVDRWYLHHNMPAPFNRELIERVSLVQKMHTRHFWTWQNPWRYKLHKHLAAPLGKVGQRRQLHLWLQHPLDLVDLVQLVRLLHPSVEAQPRHHLQHRPRLLVPLLPLPLPSQLDRLLQLQLEMGEACRPLRQRDKCLGQSQRAACSIPETGQKMFTAYTKTVSVI